MLKLKTARPTLTFALAGLVIFALFLGFKVLARPFEYQSLLAAGASSSTSVSLIPKVKHLLTPLAVKGIYMSQCVVGTPSFRAQLVDLINQTELNSVVIDIKDYTGKLAFTTTNSLLKDSVSGQCGARDMKEFIESLHEQGIYVIGRVTVFQDPFYTGLHPELAVKKMSNKETVWRDHKGLAFIDVGARPFWDYIVAIAKESYALGFDEINFDYIRFPSDGDMEDVYFSWSASSTKPEILERFFQYLHQELQPTGIITSADLFGMTTTNTDDLNIGQVWERALPYFNYLSPMVYPSHYPPTFNGWADPNQHPYDLIHHVLASAVLRTKASTTTAPAFTHTRIGTTTPIVYQKPVYSATKVRPWLQDFDYGGNYGVNEVRAQIEAAYDAGLNSWLIWDPGNNYTRDAYKIE